jgi:hypothetical protein
VRGLHSARDMAPVHVVRRISGVLKKSLGTLVFRMKSRHGIGAFFLAFLETEKCGMPKHPASMGTARSVP